jgi:hypothetical protein
VVVRVVNMFAETGWKRLSRSCIVETASIGFHGPPGMWASSMWLKP